jgi:uncharacterized damage-inducible protein DinB
MLSGTPALSQAQPAARKAEKDKPKGSPFSDVIRASWYSINALILSSAEKMPGEHYGFQPTKDIRTFAQILAHIAADHHAGCGATIGRKAPDTRFDKLKAKQELVKALQESGAVCDMAYGLLTDENAQFRYRAFDGEYTRFALLTSNVTHDSQHYGNLVTYMRLKGVLPPSSAVPR